MVDICLQPPKRHDVIFPATQYPQFFIGPNPNPNPNPRPKPSSNLEPNPNPDPVPNYIDEKQSLVVALRILQENEITKESGNEKSAFAEVTRNKKQYIPEIT